MDFQQIRKYVKGVLTNSFLNKTTLDKLSTSNEGNLLFDGKELKNIGNIEASITELWSGQQSVSAEITLLDDYANYDIIISMIEPLEDYPTQQKFDFMLKGAESLTGGMAENNTYIASYRLNNWNSTSVYFRRDNNPNGWNFTLRKIWGIKFITQQHEYSIEEKVVGKWIDGKNLYERVFPLSISQTLGTGAYINTDIDCSYMDKIIEYSLIGTYSGNGITENCSFTPYNVLKWTNNKIHIAFSNFNDGGIFNIEYMILKYTKNE